MQSLLVVAHGALPFRFDVVHSELVIDGYQLYAVEKWVVDRTRHIVTLVVYTGDPAHKITVSAITPSASLSPSDAAAEWDSALETLRKDGARPRDTPHGVLMTTSLANFRSDYTIVHIPTGNFRHIQHQLYANINLLRMGSSGRSALCLDEPSETTKDRFLSVYHIPNPTSVSVTPVSTPSKHKSHHKSKSLDPSKFRLYSSDTNRHLPVHPLLSPPAAVGPDSHRTVTNTLFCTTVIELVRIIQAALLVFGFFPPGTPSHTKSNIDGLLCDNTVDGIQHWVDEIGKPFFGIEPTERVLDPTVVSALLSIVLSIRNKLSAIGYAHVVPKDPFLHPHTMTAALATYSHTSPHAVASVHHANGRGPLPLSPTSSSSSASTSTGLTLNRTLFQAINRAYDRIRHTDPRRVHRVRVGKTDDRRGDVDVGDLDFGLGGVGNSADGTTQILSGIGSLASGFTFGLGGSGTGGAGAVFDVVLDLRVFARLVADHGHKDKRARGRGREGEAEWEERKKDVGGRDKDRDSSAIGASLRTLWNGRIETLVRIREREKENAAKTSPSHPKDKRGEGGREQSAFSDGDGEAELKAFEDEGDFTPNTRPWSGRVQRRIEALAGRSRKKQSVDLSTLSPSKSNISSNDPQISPTLPAVIPRHKDRDQGEDEDLLSSGQVSPISDLKTHPLNMLYEGSVATGIAASLANSAFNLSSASDYERRLSAFNQKRPWSNRGYQTRVSSWADPLSAQEIAEEEDDMDVSPISNFRRRATPSLLDVPEEISETDAEKFTKEQLPRGLVAHGLKRRHSFHDLESLQHMRVSRLDHMRIDVDLCGQILIMSRRAPHLRNVIACLQLLAGALSETTTSLHEEYQSYAAALSDVEARTKVFAEVNAQRLHADVIVQETNTLLYETALFDLRALWHTASPPRRQVLALREKVFGTGGRRLPRGLHGAHGRYNRLQWTLDERERLVDWLGRTESEEEEENAVDAARMEAPPGEDDEEDVVEHPAMKPMWLLRFFETWGVRWGSAKQQEDEKGRNGASTLLMVPSRDSGPSSKSLWSRRSASPGSGSDRDNHPTTPQ